MLPQWYQICSLSIIGNHCVFKFPVANASSCDLASACVQSISDVEVPMRQMPLLLDGAIIMAGRWDLQLIMGSEWQGHVSLMFLVRGEGRGRHSENSCWSQTWNLWYQSLICYLWTIRFLHWHVNFWSWCQNKIWQGLMIVIQGASEPPDSFWSEIMF
jgi:hypothetical protein